MPSRPSSSATQWNQNRMIASHAVYRDKHDGFVIYNRRSQHNCWCIVLTLGLCCCSHFPSHFGCGHGTPCSEAAPRSIVGKKELVQVRWLIVQTRSKGGVGVDGGCTKERNANGLTRPPLDQSRGSLELYIQFTLKIKNCHTWHSVICSRRSQHNCWCIVFALVLCCCSHFPQLLFNAAAKHPQAFVSFLWHVRKNQASAWHDCRHEKEHQQCCCELTLEIQQLVRTCVSISAKICANASTTKFSEDPLIREKIVPSLSAYKKLFLSAMRSVQRL